MAGDWIKMRNDLADDPAVISIAQACGLDEDTVVGKLHRLWSWADKHTTDGRTIVSAAWIDKYVNCRKFAAAMCKTGWLEISDAETVFPCFERHNGESAKKRLAVRERVERHRTRNADVTQASYTKVAISRPLRSEVIARDGGKCVYCGRLEGEIGPTETKNDGFITLDHVIPESQGGATTAINLVTCCNKCNREKADRTPEQAGFDWPEDVTGKRYGSVSKALPREEKRREEIDTPNGVSGNVKKAGKFVAPTLAAVAAYCRERGNRIDPEAFLAHYTANGWKQSNGNAIKDWKSTVITWEKRDANSATGNHPRGSGAAPQPASRVAVPPGALDKFNLGAATSAGGSAGSLFGSG